MSMISLVVPVYNMENYLHRCLESLLSQDSNNFEIILIDDGSTDSSATFCDQYVNSYPDRIKVFHKKNGGLSSARNLGISVASGEYIAFPDPDDWVEPHYVSSFLELSDSSYDLICTGYYVDFDNREIPALSERVPEIMERHIAQSALMRPDYMSGFAWNKIFRLDIIHKYNLKFMDDVGTTEDLDFAFRYLEYCQTAIFAPSVRTYHYYQRSGAATRSGFSHHKLNSLNTYRKIINCTDSPEVQDIARSTLCSAAVGLTWLHESSTSPNPAVRHQLQESIRSSIFTYLKSKYFKPRHKIQAIAALVSPTVFARAKKLLYRKP